MASTSDRGIARAPGRRARRTRDLPPSRGPDPDAPMIVEGGSTSQGQKSRVAGNRGIVPGPRDVRPYPGTRRPTIVVGAVHEPAHRRGDHHDHHRPTVHAEPEFPRLGDHRRTPRAPPRRVAGQDRRTPGPGRPRLEGRLRGRPQAGGRRGERLPGRPDQTPRDPEGRRLRPRVDPGRRGTADRRRPPGLRIRGGRVPTRHGRVAVQRQIGPGHPIRAPGPRRCRRYGVHEGECHVRAAARSGTRL